MSRPTAPSDVAFASWRPLYWEPVAGTGERIMVGVVHGFDDRWGATRIIRDDVLDCLFGKASASVRRLIDQGIRTFAAAADGGHCPEALTTPLLGLHPGPFQRTAARTLNEALHTAALMYSSLGNLDKLDDAEESDAPLPEEVNRRFSTEVRDLVVRRRPDLVPCFGRAATLIDGGQRVRFGLVSPTAVLHFTVLSATRHSSSMRDARARLFELQRARDQGGIPRAALIAAVPRDDDPTLGVKQRHQLQENKREIEMEADAVSMNWYAVTSATEGADRVIEVAG